MKQVVFAKCQEVNLSACVDWEYYKGVRVSKREILAKQTNISGAFPKVTTNVTIDSL
ncbi:hypothetical protein HJ01_01598 [Flavobacterium frigoris PS1]|uniref:Uncharacterized protein n=1 Tax=Flavobacterium frigoris (strain PS1) TaxID=1086011 RepID=H7FQT2_FLAFP|nr:hypothetical protein HJ01_01598 [Flavobacterium frigoris PS1]